jgi:hypothetical protein
MFQFHFVFSSSDVDTVYTEQFFRETVAEKILTDMGTVQRYLQVHFLEVRCYITRVLVSKLQ